MADKETPKTKVAGLNVSRFASAEQVRNTWSVTPETGTPAENFMRSEYWAHVANKLRPWDRIEVRAEDGTYFGELLVLDAGMNWARVAQLYFVELTPVRYQETKIEGYTICHKGTAAKWCVVRDSDNAIVRRDVERKEDAIRWALDNKKSIAA